MKAPLKCILVEDNIMDTDLIRNFIRRIDFLQLDEVFTDALRAQKYLAEKKVDLIIADIMLEGISGMDMVKTLRERPKVIFTTSYADYAVEGFDLDATDFLVKPVRFDRFLKAANKALSIHYDDSAPEKNTVSENPGNYFFIRSDYSFIKIYFTDIVYIQSVKDYIRVVTVTDAHLTSMNLVTIEEKLPHGDFIRIHRAIVVNKEKIESLKNDEIMVGGYLLGIGKTFKDIVYEAVVNHSLIKR